MADARITSGSGDGAVRGYTRDGNGNITVAGLRVEGRTITVRLEAPGSVNNVGATDGTDEWSVPIPATVGRHTLVVEVSGGKELRQQIDVS